MTEEITVELSDRDWTNVLAPGIASKLVMGIPEPDRRMLFGAVLAFLECRGSRLEAAPLTADTAALGSSAPLLLGRSRYFVRMKKVVFESASQAVMVVLALMTAGAAHPLANVVAFSASSLKALLQNVERLSVAERGLLVMMTEEARVGPAVVTSERLAERLGLDRQVVEQTLVDLERRSVVARKNGGWQIVV